ncbi:MAG: transcription termination/antitermination protein NusA [Deltaproteobacteria bacterium]|nr:transcription termination/antitermination protein NusA [Deltaproteobacteria bacterium]
MDKNLDLKAVIEQVGKEKNIEKEVIVGALESAMLSAARKNLGPSADLEARYNEDLSEVEVYEFKKIVKEVTNPSVEIAFEAAMKLDPELTEDALGEDLGIKLDANEFGRIAAQNAKQIIVQKVREAERSLVYDEYKDRKDELVTGIVRRFEKGSVVVDLGRAEAIIPTREQISKENIRVGDRIVAYVLDVLEESRGSQIILSRTHPNLVVKLFEQEVPEISEGTVTIEAAAREAGFRTKIAVRSKDSDVDPVGACVGMRGARVQAVIQELKGEKIDIVPFEQDEARFVCNALAPAEISRVLVNETEHAMQIVVPDDQLSLAIGRRGQNVRLAAEISGWKIDIDSESKAAKEREEAEYSLSQVEGLSDIQIQTLYNHGFRKAEDVATAEVELLKSLPGIQEEEIEALQESAKTVMAQEKVPLSRQKARYLFELASLNLDLSGLELPEEELKILDEAYYSELMDLVLDTPEHLAQITGFSRERAQSIHEKALSLTV